MLLSPTQIHAVQHFCPVLRFCAACTGMQCQNSVILIVIAGKQCFQAHRLKRFRQMVNTCPCLFKNITVFSFIAQFTEHFNVFVLLSQFFEPVDSFLQMPDTGLDMLSRIYIIPEIRFLSPGLQLSNFIFSRRDMKCFLQPVKGCFKFT